MAKKRVLGVVGMGHVGAHVAYALAIQGIADELVLVDQNEQKLASEVQDLRDAVAYMPHRVTVRGGGFSDLGVCDVIVNSVGKIDLLRGTHDRLTEMDFTIPAVRGYAEKIKASGFDGVLINITNPCDIVTRELALHLAMQGKQVTVVARRQILRSANLPAMNDAMLRDLLAFHKVTILEKTGVESVADNGIALVQDGTPLFVEADTIIESIGFRSEHTLFDEIKNDYEHVFVLGDGRKVHNIHSAIWDGFEAARMM